MVLDNPEAILQRGSRPLNLDFKLQPTPLTCDGVRLADENLVRRFLRGGNAADHPAGSASSRTAARSSSGKNAPRRHDRLRRRPNAALIDLVIQEVDREGNVSWEWDASEHFDVADATSDIDLTKSVVDWAHCNAIDIDADGNLLLSSRHLDEITKIDRATGEILWRLGGEECRNNQFTLLDDFLVEGGDTLFFGFSHQHGVRLAGGHILSSTAEPEADLSRALSSTARRGGANRS
jgi:hypothetical protein